MNSLHANSTSRIIRHARIVCALTVITAGAAFAAGTAAPDQSAAAAEVVAFEQKMELAVLHGDVTYLEKIIPADFAFTHGDGWTKGGPPLRTDTRASWLATIAKAPYVKRDLESVKVEMHGDIAITYGKYTAKFKPGMPDQRDFIVWFERVYAKRNGQWQYLSHRTVNGPDYQGPLTAAK